MKAFYNDEEYHEKHNNFERRLLRDKRIIMIAEGIHSISAQKFIEDILILSDSVEPITIYISSDGGDMYAGLAIIAAIRLIQKKGVKIISHIYGHAQSMAFLILQCCDERMMGKLDMLMCHGITADSFGDIKDFESRTKLLKKYQADFSELIAKRCIVDEYRDEGTWYAILASNTPQYYDCEESLKMGLIDKIE